MSSYLMSKIGIAKKGDDNRGKQPNHPHFSTQFFAAILERPPKFLKPSTKGQESLTQPTPRLEAGLNPCFP
jgi:hypothetical protein